MVDMILEGGVILLVVVAVGVWGFMALICIMGAYFQTKDWFWWKVTYRVHERTAESQKIIDSIMEESKKAHPPSHPSQAHPQPDRARLTTSTSMDFADRVLEDTDLEDTDLEDTDVADTDPAPRDFALMDVADSDLAHMDFPAALEQLRSERKDRARRQEMTRTLETHWNNTGVK